MSTTIDQKVVEMRFDNRHFENNVKTTLSTLDKLKLKLNLSSSSKSLEKLGTTANNINMNGLSNSLSTIQTKFSAMEVVGVTALANITNSAVNAGKRMIAALTIDPVTTGLKEYETQINAVQTILANTQKEGTNVEIVNRALDELNEYADKTIYNFTEMTRNIGTFTAAGVKLDTSVKAIKGISNLAAVSGSTSQQASTAMYQLSQALSSGTVKLMDWNSVVNAGMGGQVFQDALKETARVHGIAIDKIIEQEGSFRDSLSTGWLSADILTETLEKFTLASNEMTEAEKERTKAMLQSKGYTDEQIESIFKLGNTATEAATKVKTFTQLWDVLKEAAQSGWAQSWRIIIGDFEEAKALLTPLADFLTGIINKFSQARNKLLEGALSKNPIVEIFNKIADSNVFKAASNVSEKINGISKSLEYYQKMVNKVWRGDYKNQPYRFGLLRAEGHDPRVIQTLVNKGYKYKLTIDDVIAAEKKYGIVVEETVENTEEMAKNLAELSDEKLREIGLTEEEIEVYRELVKQSKRTGKSIDEIISAMNQRTGRELLIDSFKNFGLSLVSIFSSIGEAWRDAFPPMNVFQLYSIVEGLNKFSVVIRTSVEKNADKLTRTLKGLFAILDLISMVVGGGIRIAFTILKTVLGLFNLNILDLTAIVGDAIVAFRDWVEQFNPITLAVTKLVPFIVKMGKAIGKFAKQIWELPGVQRIVEKITKAFSKLGDIKLKDVTSMLKKLGVQLKKLFSNINKHFGGVPGDILSGLVNGIKNGTSKVLSSIVELANKLINKFKEILGIHSPSRVFFAIGGFIIAGLIGGLLSGSTGLGDTVGTIASKIGEFFQNINWGGIFSKLFTGGMSVGLLIVAKNLTDTLKNFSSLAGGVGHMFYGFGEVASEFSEGVEKITKSVAYTVKSFGKVLRGIAFKKTAEGIKELAWSLLIIAGAVYLLGQLDYGKLWSAVGAIFVLSAVLAALAFGVSKLSESSVAINKNGLELKGVKASLFGIGAAVLMLGFVVKMMGGMEPDEMKQGFLGLAGAVVAMSVMMAAYGLLIKGKAAQNMDKAGKMLKKMAKALLLMVLVVKLVSWLKPDEMKKGAAFMTGFVIFVGALMLVTSKSSKNIDKVGKAISKISWALILMVAVVKLVSLLEYSEMLKGAAFLLGFVGFVKLLVMVSKIGKEQQIAKIGGMMLGISASLLLMVGVVKLCGMMDLPTLLKGGAAVVAFGAIIAGLLYMVKLIGPQAPKLAATISAMGLAIGILAASAIVLSLIDIGGLAKGVVAVGLLGLVMSTMIKATKFTSDVKGSIIGMAIAIGVIAASVAVLSFIRPDKLYSAVGAIGLLMGMFALIENQSRHVTGSWATLAVMAGTIAILATALGLLGLLPVENLLGAAVGLSLLMGAMAGVMIVIGKFSITGKAALQGALALTAMCIPLVALVGILYVAKDIKNAISTATALSGLLLVMTGVLGVLTIIGATGPAAFIGIGALATLIVGITAVVVAIGALMEKFPALQKFLDVGLSALIALAGGIGEMIGAFAKGIMTQVSSALPQIGMNLAMFMMNAMPFINGVKLVDKSVLTGTGILAAAIIALSAANLIDGITSFLPFIGSFADMGTELSVFMKNAMPFIQTAMTIPPNALDGVRALSESIMLITKANLLDGIGRLIGAGSLEKFATQMPYLAGGLTNFMATLGPIDEAQVATAKNAAEIIKTLALAASEIPNTGGLLGQIVGNNDMGPWSQQLPLVGKGIVDFVKTLTDGGIATNAVETAKTAAEMIKTLATVASEIPNTGGLLSALIGDNPLDKFAEGLPKVGAGISGFIRALLAGNINSNSVEMAKTAAEVIKSLANVSKDLPNTGGLLAALVGDNDLSDFASKLPDVGRGIAGFAEALGMFDEQKVTTVVTAANAMRALADLGKLNLKDIGKNLDKFGSNIKSFGSKLKDFVNIIVKIGAENITNALDKVSTLINTLSETANTKSDQIKQLGESLKTVAKDGVKGFVNTFSKKSTLDSAKEAMIKMIKSAIKGAESKKKDVVDEFEDIVDDAIDTLDSKDAKEDIYDAGKAFVQGFANGIKDHKYLATNAGSSVGKAALKAAKEAIDSNSPSKEAMKIGGYFGEGFAIGISDYTSKVYNVSEDVANNAKNGLSRALSKVMNLINSDMDTQPTIRPVLDLSDVESGAGYLNSMFNTNPSIGVMSNVRAISSGMNARIQNGVNNDVVSAIDDLGKKLGNVGGTTNNYNVNGVSYNDESNVANAVQTLIRAVIMEGRI